MNRSIKRDFQYLSLFTIIVSMVLLSGFWIFYDYRSLQLESQRIRSKLMTEYRDMLQYHVNRVVNEIKYEQSISESSLKKSLKERVQQGGAIADSIVSEYRGKVDEQFLRKLIKDSLQAIRFDNGKGSLFIIKENGTVDLQPLQGGGEDRNSDITIEDSDRILTRLKTENEGFLQYNSTSEGNSAEIPTLTYVTHLPDLEWIIGTSESLDDFTAKVQQDVIARTELIRLGKDGKDYIFITTYDGVSMTYPAKGKNMIETHDPNGVYIVKELIKQAKAGGGFVQYVMPTLGGLASKPKLSYAAPIPEWQWYVGAGIYIDEIDTLIMQNREIFKQRMRQHLLIMALVLGTLLILHFVIAFFISRKVWRQIDLFSSFFSKARTDSVSMETRLLDYKEFREISRLANEMLKERNNILQEIRLSRDEWVNTFNAIGDCIIILDGHGIIERANESAGNFFSIPPTELVGKRFDEICDYENPADLTLQDHALHTMEIDAHDHNMSMLSSSFPLFSEQGELTRIIVVAHDITEKKHLEQQLLQAHKMEAIGTLAGGIAHDFNNILSAIIGYTEIAYYDLQEQRPINQYLEQVLKAGGRAKDLVKQILTFSRQAKMTKAIVQPAIVVKEALQLLRSSLPTTIKIEQQIDENCGTVCMDPTQLHQIIMNICTNAYHAMEEQGGTLSVTLSQRDLSREDLRNHPELSPGLFVELLIGDEGCGIAPDIQKKIFDPFFTTKELGKGTGMGLAIVHGIVKDCKGFLSFTSESGKGTTFAINLPVCSELPDLQAPDSQIDAIGTMHILIIDDEKMLVEMLAILLERSGFTVSSFSSSINALASFEKNPELFDLVITDQTMPEMTGIDLARKLLLRRPDLPIILCSGYSSAISADEVQQAGIKGFAMKPLVREEILQLISTVMNKT